MRATEPPSGLRHICSVWLWLARRAGHASGALLLAAVRSFRSAEAETGRGRIARNEPGKRAKQAKKPWHGALWLNALPSRPSGTYHAAPKLASEEEGAGLLEQREGCV